LPELSPDPINHVFLARIGNREARKSVSAKTAGK